MDSNHCTIANATASIVLGPARKFDCPAKYNSFILAPAVKAQTSLEIGRNGFLLNQEMRHFIFICSTVPVPLPVVWSITFFCSSSKDDAKSKPIRPMDWEVFQGILISEQQFLSNIYILLQLIFLGPLGPCGRASTV